jgi:hypothetical protein
MEEFLMPLPAGESANKSDNDIAVIESKLPARGFADFRIRREPGHIDRIMQREDMLGRYRCCLQDVAMNDFRDCEDPVHAGIRVAVERITLGKERTHPLTEDNCRRSSGQINCRNNRGEIVGELAVDDANTLFHEKPGKPHDDQGMQIAAGVEGKDCNSAAVCLRH